ncbi:MAG: ABC transporter permease [Bacteroidetes bacterium]|nr:ABC transporter permease [Bacteroidota bacterium]
MLQEEPKLQPEMFVFEPAEVGESEKLTRPSLSYWKDAWRRFKKNKVALFAVLLLISMIFLAVFAPMISKYTYYEQDFDVINNTPSVAHLFGTDELGRDIWVRSWEGARVSLFIAFVATVINGGFGIIYGGISGYLGGKTDNIMMRICEIITAVPQMLWILMLVLIMKPGIWPIIVAISATGWVNMARLFRGQVFQIRETEFVMASQTLGAKSFWIIGKHLLPNAMSPVLTNLAFTIPRAIFAEAFLSYIGLGLPMPMASWGVLASDGAAKLLVFPYQLAFPALLISLSMLSFNLLGDGLRDALDPKLRD